MPKPLKDLLAHFGERKARAIERLRNHSGESWHFALLGLKPETPSFDFGEGILLCQVEDSPGEVELAAALEDKSLMSVVGRYSHAITHELVIPTSAVGTDQQHAFTVAWWHISALRVKTLVEILVPVAANRSWSTIAGIDDGSCLIKLIEDVPSARGLEDPQLIPEPDLKWTGSYAKSIPLQLRTDRFRLALECLTTHGQERSLRMSAASIWVGLEALFGLRAELKFRLALLISTYLEARGPSRIALYEEIKKSYDFRSKAVHGAKLADEELVDHIRRVRRLLSRVLVRIIESDSVPDDVYFEHLLLE